MLALMITMMSSTHTPIYIYMHPHRCSPIKCQIGILQKKLCTYFRPKNSCETSSFAQCPSVTMMLCETQHIGHRFTSSHKGVPSLLKSLDSSTTELKAAMEIDRNCFGPCFSPGSRLHTCMCTRPYSCDTNQAGTPARGIGRSAQFSAIRILAICELAKKIPHPETFFEIEFDSGTKKFVNWVQFNKILLPYDGRKIRQEIIVTFTDASKNHIEYIALPDKFCWGF